MSKILCIPRQFLPKLSEGVKNGDFDIAKMMEMSSEDRRTMFRKYLPEAEAKFANTQFEKAITSNRKNALMEWAEKTFQGKYKTKKQDVMDKINRLKAKDLLNPSQNFYEDLVADQLGISISAKEAETIIKLSDELEKLKSEKMQLGDGSFIDAPSLAYMEKYNEIMQFLEGVNSSSNLKVFTSIWTRVFMLASAKSPIVNIAGNTSMLVASKAVRTMRYKMVKGMNSDLAKSFYKTNMQIANKTGYDLSRMYSLGDKKVLGEKVVTTQGDGKFRATSRVLEKFVFGKLLFGPDVRFATIHFADTVNLETTKLALDKGLTGDKAKQYARAIMKDAFAIEPSTFEGQEVRKHAMQEAFYGTFTNDSKLSDMALNTRKFVNSITGDLSLGDMIIPFAKTPANVVSATLDYSGVKIPLDLVKLAKGIKSENREMIMDAQIGLYRAWFGAMGVVIMALAIDPEDYVSEYADYYSKEKQLIALEGASYNSVKIGDTWVSLDYFGPFAAGLVGILSARKYGKNLGDDIFRYFVGAARQTLKVPGFQELSEFLGDIQTTTQKFYKDGTMAGTEELQKSIASFTSARVIPAIMGDIAIAMDEYDRRKDTALSQFMGRVPGLRERLPEKISLFGEEIKAQPGAAQILFGSRVKFSNENEIISEINRLSLSGNMPTVSNIEYTSDRAKLLKAYLGAQEFKGFVKELGSNLTTSWTKLIKSNAYSKMTDEQKKDYFNKIRTKIVDAIIKKHIKINEHKIKEAKNQK